ncbi:MAG: hypothetical protein HY736_13920 [Verrucomicrobia bacterium]|nr:hypothetical protein [Verrucomicrobiota bacterium]
MARSEADRLPERRPEILELFRTHMYGRSPDKVSPMTFEATSVDKQALGGKATRKEVTIRTGGDSQTAYDWEQYLNFADRHFGRGR